MAQLLYLDYNCFQRGFDDQRQTRIRMEAAACERIFDQAEAGRVEIAWSFMHEDENRLCPFPARSLEILRLSAICRRRVAPTEVIRRRASEIQAEAGLASKDALHLAAALEAKAACFVTCDDGILHKAHRVPFDLVIVDPIHYVLDNG